MAVKKILLYILVAVYCTGCAHFHQQNNRHLQAGIWRGILHRTDGVGVPFNFKIEDTANKRVMYIMNGAARMLVDSIRYRGDTVFIHMPFFNSDFWAHFQNDGSLKGEWIKHYPDSNRTLGFSASPKTDYRITPSSALPKYDVSGRWRTTFISTDKKDTTQAVGEFHQEGNKLTGTFLTKSGDYRYLQGVMDGDTLKLSTFDGSHVFLFKAQATDSNTLTNGVFYSGFSGIDTWTAYRDSSAHLPNAFALTTYKPGEDQLNFTFPDLEGKPVSIHDKQFKGKVVIVQIMGSWCPNCMDETNFLSAWYNKNKNLGVKIIGLCYERSVNFNEAVKNVTTFKSRFDVTYPLLITGITPGDPHLLEKTLPQLQHFVGFPTTIFIDKKGDIAKIHAGFSGPGTGEHYAEFVKGFNQLVDRLAAE